MPHVGGQGDLKLLGDEDLRRLVHGLLLEWTQEVEVDRGHDFVDFLVSSVAPLGVPLRQRVRLFLKAVSDADLAALDHAALRGGERPVGIAPRGSVAHLGPRPATLTFIDADQLRDLCEESALVAPTATHLEIDAAALNELADVADTRLALVNGLVWLRALSRDRVPPALRWTGRPAYQLFERCFFVVMSSTFGTQGVAWGAAHPGESRPDGVLEFPSDPKPALYDCKASFHGYAPTFRDILGFADYIKNPGDWTPPPGVTPRFLVVSSGFELGTKAGSYAGRAALLSRRVPGAVLSLVRAPDLVRFGLALERARVKSADRAQIGWSDILDVGDVRWPAFEAQLARLSLIGPYEFEV